MSKMIVIVALLLLSACSTLSKTECETANWYEMGIIDGQRGRASNRFSEYAKSCAKHAIEADEERYFSGREQGLKLYCTLDNAYNVGLAGDNYNGVCSAKIEAQFLQRYREGRIIYELRAQLEAAQAEISRLQTQVNNLQNPD